MPTRLPLFPLQLVVFPGEELNLHIFEPRYRQLVQDAEQEQLTFGIPAFIDDRVMSIGTEVELLGVAKRYPNGESDINTRGVGLFRLEDYVAVMQGKLYAGGMVERVEPELAEDPINNAHILMLVRQLFDLLRVKKELPLTDAEMTTYRFAHHIGLSLEQEYQLLCTFEAHTRQAMLIEHLERITAIVRESEALRRKAQMNGHFKNIIPPNF